MFAAGVTSLVLATWLHEGYRYEVWPQPSFLSYVLSCSGQLRDNWFTSLPAAHWAVDHLLALVRASKLDEAVLLMWLLLLVALWASFLSICRSLGAPVCVRPRSRSHLQYPLAGEPFEAERVVHPRLLAVAVALDLRNHPGDFCSASATNAPAGSLVHCVRASFRRRSASTPPTVLLQPGA